MNNKKFGVNVDWNVMKSVIEKLRNEDWSVKFENDSDVYELENIAEESIDIDDTIHNDVDYFKLSGRDPVVSSRILLEPDDDTVRHSIIIFYGKEIETYDVPDKYVNYVLELIKEVKNELKEVKK